MLKIIYILLLFTLINKVFSESCTKYDFENNFDILFSNNSVTCKRFSSWQIDDYSNIRVQRPNYESTKFISPVRVASGNEWQLLNNCIRSFEIQMGAGGVVEVMFYIEAKSQRDILYVTASKILPSGSEVEVGFARYSMSNSDYSAGWNILRLEIGDRDAQFDGYVYFYGTMTDEAIILIDSFRYITSTGETENCDLELITEYPITVIDSDTAINNEDCTTYNFETNYESLFNNETNFCKGSLSWELQTYDSINIQSPHTLSSSFIAPFNISGGSLWQTFSSCVSSFHFPIVESGSLEVNLYMEAKTPFDILYVDVKQIIVGDVHVSVASETYSMLHTGYSAGWKVLKMNFEGTTSAQFDGYVSFLAVLSEGSVLIIDSFRYISSTISEENCIIYTEIETTTTSTTTEVPSTTEIPTTTDEPTTTNAPSTTEIPTTTDEPTTTTAPTTTEIPITTDSPTATDNPTTNSPIDEGKCVIYDFENDFDSKFSNGSSFCKGFPLWNLDAYSNINIVRPHTHSNHFIKPTLVFTEDIWQTMSSCGTSFKFLMEVGGVIEVKFYMEAKSQSDNLLVAASRTGTNGFDVIINVASHSPIDPNYNDGWNTLRIEILTVPNVFEGYLLFLGTISEDAVLIVDSFRYIGPSVEEDSCVVYVDEETTTITSTTDDPTTTTTAPTTVDPTTTTIAPTTTTIAPSTTTIVPTTDEPTTADSTTTTITPNTDDPTTIIFVSTTDDPTTTTIVTTTVDPTTTTIAPFTADPTTTTIVPTTDDPTTTTIAPTTDDPTTITFVPTTDDPTTTTIAPTTDDPTTITFVPTTDDPTTTTIAPTTDGPTTTNFVPTTNDPTTTTIVPTTTTIAPTTDDPITTTIVPTTEYPTTTTIAPTTTTIALTTDDLTTTTIAPITPSITPTTDDPTTTIASTTDDPTTTTISPTTDNPTTSSTIDEGKCVIYDFENDFDSKFSNESSFCNGFPLWNLDSYTNINVVSPHTESNHFIKPTFIFTENIWQTMSSCGTSFTFSMEAGGVIEVKFYMEAKVQSDNLLVAASHTAANGFDVIINSASYSPIDPDYRHGWNTLRIEILTVPNVFEGYLLFLGTISEDAVLIVDSFRYIGPSIDENSCAVYVDEETTTITLTTDDPTTTTTASTTVDQTTTTISPVEEDLCITYDFEDDFHGLFTQDISLCIGLTTWHLGNYSMIEMSGFDARSDVFMSPSKDLSCIASFPFPMNHGGTVEVNVFMDSVSNLDYITVLAKMIVPNGIDTVAGMNSYNPSSAGFVRGWNILRINLASLIDFNGYLLFLGGAAGDSKVIVDSFRYIPPGVSAGHKSCAIY